MRTQPPYAVYRRAVHQSDLSSAWWTTELVATTVADGLEPYRESLTDA